MHPAVRVLRWLNKTIWPGNSPAAKVVVAIPPTADRVILYRFDPEAALETSNLD
jgi:hypothetical protein